jgi:predicted phage terminase large subunit-like protein
MIFMPPRHGKSELVSRLFPAYLLYLHPDREVGLASYAASLAEQLGADARSNYEEIGGELDKSTAAKKDWRTTRGGRMWSEGVGGSLTGKGFHYGIIDDPFKGAEDSGSRGQREKVKEWYQSVFYTRQAPQASIVFVNTRWHEDDLSGWQIAEEWNEQGEDGMPERWHIVSLQAIRDLDEDPEFPPSCVVEPDWRQHGEALDPFRYPLQKLLRYKRIGSYFWAALFQQRPIPKGGGIFQRSWFKYRLHITDLPQMVKKIAAADLAYTEKTSADFTVLFPMSVDVNGRYYLYRPYRAQVEAPAALQGMAARTKEFGASIVGVEKVAAQSAYVSHLRLRPEMIGIAVVGLEAETDKESRARGWAPIAEQSLITLVSDGTGWEDVFLDELCNFPRSRWDDQVDGVGLCFQLLRETSSFSAAGGGPSSSSDVRAKLKT